MAYVTQTQKGEERNRLYLEDLPVHEWYRFVLSFPPHLVRAYIERFGLSSEQWVFDPFCGTGTTLVECKKLGIPSIGLEANPVVHFAAQVKTNRCCWDSCGPEKTCAGTNRDSCAQTHEAFTKRTRTICGSLIIPA